MDRMFKIISLFIFCNLAFARTQVPFSFVRGSFYKSATDYTNIRTFAGTQFSSTWYLNTSACNETGVCIFINPTSPYNMVTSNKGVSFTDYNSPQLAFVTYGGGTFYASFGTNFYKSTNGTSWTLDSTNILGSKVIMGMRYIGGNLYALLGPGCSFCGVQGYFIGRFNGSVWGSVSSTYNIDTNSILFQGMYFAGSGSTYIGCFETSAKGFEVNATCWRSTNSGSTWTPSNTTPGVITAGIEFFNGNFYAATIPSDTVGNPANLVVKKSSDGLNWTTVLTTSAGNDLGYHNLITQGDGLLVVGGRYRSGVSGIWTSTDGTNWNQASSSPQNFMGLTYSSLDKLFFGMSHTQTGGSDYIWKASR